MKELTGKRALVTSGSRGIGAAIALALAEQGAAVAISCQHIGSNTVERVPFPDLTLYALTKSAHLAFTRSLAQELTPRKITVNVVQPGPIDTELNPAVGEEADFTRSFIPLAPDRH
jgi:NAD(P)-dependent dehydrogenase (short-subunit alcohol dehydrogenase family)